MAHPVASIGTQNQAIQHIEEIWEITNDPESDLDAKIGRLLELESDELDLPYGFVTSIDVTADTQTIEHARGDYELLHPGETHRLSESYCRKTIQQPDGVFHIDDAHADGFDTDPAYRRFELGTYIGSTIEFSGDLYGTFCFASSNPRDEQITDGERTLLHMLATWASNAIHQQQTRAKLVQNVDQAEELAGVVSHDLRNPLGVAKGELVLMNENIQESISTIDKAHQRIETLIDDMLTLTRLDEPVENPSAVALKRCVAESWDTIQTGEATLTMAFENESVWVDESRLKRLFDNLFQNAIEHGGRSVSLEVGVTETGFYVADDGPGIPAAERESVFQTGYSEKAGNMGFGLSIVRKIAAAHGWEITITDSASGGTRFDITGVDFAGE